MKISAGGTAKYLMGLGHFSMVSQGMQLHTFGRDSMQILQSDVQVSYSETQIFQRIMNGLVGGLPSFRNILGYGLGFDFGVAVEIGRASCRERV